MAQTPIDIDVRDDRDSGRFVVDHNGSTAELTYTAEVRLILAHTEVPLCLEGRGLGGQLVRAAVSRARSEHSRSSRRARSHAGGSGITLRQRKA